MSVSGVTVLTPGLTTQLVAKLTTSAGSSVASDAIWHSQDPNIANVSATGLVTGVNVGTVVITAAVGSVTGQTSITVQPVGTGTSALSACTAIHTPGAYSVDNDLTGTGACLDISKVASVQIDCRGHAVSGLSVSQANNVTINNCSIPSQVTLNGVSTIALRQCVLTGGLGVGNAVMVEITDSTLTAAVDKVVIATGSGITLLRDTVSNTSTNATAAVYFHDGLNNQVVNTKVKGVFDWSGTHGGTDDGIVLLNETSDTLENDTFSGFYDGGIETLDDLASTTITNNNFSNIGLAAIAAYWCTNWTNNTVQGNRAAEMPALVWIFYKNGANCGARPAQAAFSGNQFVGNVFRDQIGSLNGTGAAGPSMDVRMSGAVSGNLLRDNDFGSYNGPFLSPPSGFIDGGGNICAPPVPGISNFDCTGGSSMRSRNVTRQFTHY